jgi:hypothetical protein
MTDIYLKDKAAKKRFLLKGLIALSSLSVIFAIFITSFALSGSAAGYANNAPESKDAYLIAKQFVRPTIRSSRVSFPESDYQCAQKPDSIFIVKSYAEAGDQPKPKNVTTFEITLKFLGGNVADSKNWKMLRINED